MSGLSDEGLMNLLEAWDEVSAAIDRVVTSLPSQISEASERLEDRRRNMRLVINSVTRPTHNPEKEE